MENKDNVTTYEFKTMKVWFLIFLIVGLVGLGVGLLFIIICSIPEQSVGFFHAAGVGMFVVGALLTIYALLINVRKITITKDKVIFKSFFIKTVLPLKEISDVTDGWWWLGLIKASTSSFTTSVLCCYLFMEDNHKISEIINKLIDEKDNPNQ